MTLSDSRTAKFLRNTGGSATYQIVNLIYGLITPRIILQCYGSHLNGLVSSISQFLSCLAVVEAGLALAAQQSLYAPLAKKDGEKTSAIVSATRRAYNRVGFLFTALTALLAVFYPIAVHVKSLNYIQVVLLVFVLSMNYVLPFFIISKYQALLSADQRVYVISLSKSLARIANLILVIVFSLAGTHILVMRTVVILSLVLQAAMVWLYAKKKYPHINYYAEPDTSALQQRWDAMYLQILGAVTISAPAILLTFTSSLEAVSIYTVYNMVFSALMSLLGIFTNGINASFGELLHAESLKKTADAYSEFENIYYSVISVIYLVTLITITPFIKLYTSGITDANYLLPGLGILFTANALLYNIKTPQGMMVQAAGQFRNTRMQNTVQAAILLIAGIVLGYFFGIYGVLIASILSNGYRCIDLMLFIPKRVLHNSYLPTLRRIVTLLVLITLGYIPTVFVFQHLTVHSFYTWMAVAVVAALYAALIIFGGFFLFEKKYYLKTMRRLKIMIRKGRS